MIRCVTLFAITAGWLGTMPHAVAEADEGLNDDTYVSEDYGWSVEFDDRVWEAEEVDERSRKGVELSGNDIFAILVVYDADLEEANECLDATAFAVSRTDGFENVSEARRLDPPKTDREAAGRLHTATLELQDDDVDAALYLECREVDNAALSVVVATPENNYEDALPDIEELLDGIQVGSVSASTRTSETRTRNEDDEEEESSDGGRETIEISGSSGSSPSRRYDLEAGQYELTVSGYASDGFGGIFSVTIQGDWYIELPFNNLIEGSGPYSAESEVYIDTAGPATISVSTFGLDDWTLTMTLLDSA